jgi:hypothetical protein
MLPDTGGFLVLRLCYVNQENRIPKLATLSYIFLNSRLLQPEYN